ncbi:YhdP family protein [Thioalkalivibrio thiocyanodenitrificans]|uniref:YhdP family protein n=1 Tax=Thioalkalivibrio thiocyanodenitrificans TaxID=243063 RepID=UPI000477015F|nr:YhdP family protein [Thioalkalivibrio thiocyanodenitrificans]
MRDSESRHQETGGTPRERAGGWRVAWRGGLSRLKAAAIWITAGGLILLAVLVTTLRLALPMAADYREQVAFELGDRLGYRVEIGALNAGWHLLGPRIHLDQVAIFGDESGPPLLQLDRLDLGVRLWHSLWQRQWRFHSVRVLGADVHVVRDADGLFRVSGAGTVAADNETPVRDGGARVLEMLAGTTFRLQSSRLRYTDRVMDLDYRFDDLNLGVAVGADTLRLAGQVFLPPELGRDLTVGVDVTGDPEVLESWRGQVHVRGQGIVIDALPDDALARRINVQSGVVDMEMWSRIAAGRPDRVRARVQAADLRLAPPGQEENEPAPEPVRLDRLAVDALWEQRGSGRWQLRLHRLQLQHAGRPSVRMGLSLFHEEVEGTRRFWGEAEGVRVDHLLPLVLSQDILDVGQRSLLAGLRPAGELPRVRFHGQLPEIGEPQFAATGAFRELAVEPHERLPGFHGLSGDFSVYHDGGEVSLNSRHMRVDVPRLFADSLWASAVRGTVDWTRHGDGYRVTSEDLHVHNEDVRAGGRLVLDLGPEPRMDLEVEFADGDGSRAARYLPVGIMPEPTYRWLSRSIVDGRVLDGRLVFSGPFRKFPLEGDDDIFEVRARVSDGVLDYQPGWSALREVAGELIFDDRGMRAENASGRLLDARISDADVRIADYRAAELEVRGQARGPLSDMLRYVRESPLVSGLDGLLDDTRAEGDSRLDLALTMPLHRGGGGPAATRVSGAVELDGNRLRLETQPVDFTRVTGRVAFTEATVTAEQVQARFNDESLSLDASMPDGGPLTVRAEGMQPVAALAAHLPNYLRPHLRGRSHWSGEFTAPIDGTGSPRLRLESMLEGVTSELPEPLAKTSGVRVPLHLEVPLGPTRDPVHLRYGTILSGVLQPDNDGLSGELRFNAGDARMPEEGLRIAGRMERVNLDAWHAVAEAHPADAAEPPPGSRVSAIDLHAGEVISGARVVRDVHLSALRGRERWQVRVDSAALRGELQIPRELRGVAPLTFNMERVDLDRMAAPAGGVASGLPRLDPRTMPGLRGGIQELVHDGRRFTDLRIEATPVRDGIQVHHLQAGSAGGHASLRITGDWRIAAPDRHQTRLRYDLRTSHLGLMLTDLGFQHGFDQGEGKMEGQVRWPDAPTHFTWDGLQGDGRVDIIDGRLVEMDPGAGRLLGLFSLNMLPRRLALDFRDVFQRGFLFDKLEGTIHLVGSDAYTSDLRIQGVAANVEIEGRTGIVARDHDQRIVVTPRVGGALPVAGALLGGPMAGAAVFILDRVLGMGRGIDAAARVEYRVTGTWQDPVVETLARPAGDDLPG